MYRDGVGALKDSLLIPSCRVVALTSLRLLSQNMLGDDGLHESYDKDWASPPILERLTTRACILFSKWGVHERRVGLLILPAV